MKADHHTSPHLHPGVLSICIHSWGPCHRASMQGKSPSKRGKKKREMLAWALGLDIPECHPPPEEETLF